MKFNKLLIAFLLTFSLVACGTKTDEPKEETKHDPVEKVEEKEEEKVVELNEEEIINADFSSIAGEYENSLGEIITLDNQGYKNDREEANGPVQVGMEPKSYMLPLKEKDQMTGYAMMVFPVGTEIMTLESDTSKIRIAYGHDLPLNEEEVFVKK